LFKVVGVILALECRFRLGESFGPPEVRSEFSSSASQRVKNATLCGENRSSSTDGRASMSPRIALMQL